jgi:hypothetical protein
MDEAWERQLNGVEDLQAKTVPCSCMCGGDTAWMVKRPSGAWEMAGCVCHNPRPASVSAAFPLVASESPQVAQSGQGRLRRWLDRMRRTP